MLPRVVRDRTQTAVRAFEVIQGGAVILFVILRRDEHPSSPRQSWRVTFRSKKRKATLLQGEVSSYGETPEEAYRLAGLRFVSVKPRGNLPLFTVEEWVTVTDELRAQGAFEP